MSWCWGKSTSVICWRITRPTTTGCARTLRSTRMLRSIDLRRQSGLSHQSLGSAVSIGTTFGWHNRYRQVLFRAAHHSARLEIELARRNIPFVKYGGLKFVEAAHVKDLLAFLRLAENPRDEVAAARVLPLMPGVGPAKARQLSAMLAESGGDFAVWAEWKPPAGSAKLWPEMVA